MMMMMMMMIIIIIIIIIIRIIISISNFACQRQLLSDYTSIEREYIYISCCRHTVILNYAQNSLHKSSIVTQTSNESTLNETPTSRTTTILTELRGPKVGVPSVASSAYYMPHGSITMTHYTPSYLTKGGG